MKIALCDFWDNFNLTNNFFTHLFKETYGNIEITDISNADIVIYSCFGHSHYNAARGAIKIFYTGENLRPNYNECHYSLTFDFDSYDGRNVRVPLWLVYMDWFNCKTYGNPQLVPLSECYNIPMTEREKFCVLVNNHLRNDRDTIMKRLSKYRAVSCYGKPFNNHFDGENSKIDILKQHKFTICFENTIYPGYHTEKLFHAKVAGCIPLYNGHKAVERDFNSKSFLNLQDFSSIEEFCETVEYLDQNNAAFEEMRQQPMFLTKPSLDTIKAQIKDMIK